MLLAIDVGNTNTVFAIFEKNKKLAQWRCSTSEERTADEYFVWFKSLMDLNNFNLKKIDGMIFSSVVPKVGFTLTAPNVQFASVSNSTLILTSWY